MPGLVVAPEADIAMESPRVRKSKKAKAEAVENGAEVVEVVKKKKEKKEKKSKLETNGATEAASPKSEKKSKKRRAETSIEGGVVEKKAKAENGVVVPKKQKKKEQKSDDETEEQTGAPKEPVPADDPNHLSHFQISKEVVAKLKAKGIEALFPIQAKTFDIVLGGTDLVGRARTGQASSTLMISDPHSCVILIDDLFLMDSGGCLF